jgi:hypothetical protein
MVLMENWVKMPLAMLAYDTSYYVTDDEALVYAHLVLERQYKSPVETHTNIELINGYLQLDKSNQSRGKERIRVALDGLSRKGYITIINNDEKMKNNSFLTISFYLVDDKLTVTTHDSHQTKFTGYTELHYEDFLKTRNDGRYIKVLMHTLYRQKISYRVSNAEWANVLQVSEKTVIRDKEKWSAFVTEIKGKKYRDKKGNARQEPSTYIVGETNSEEIQYKGVKAEVEIQRFIKDCTDKRFDKNPNLFLSKSKLTAYDMYLWMTTNCEIAKAQGEKRFDLIINSKSKGGKAMIEDFKREALAMIKVDEQKAHAKKVKEAQQESNMEHYMEETITFKKQTREDEILGFIN